jgi:hypothetical protein
MMLHCALWCRARIACLSASCFNVRRQFGAKSIVLAWTKRAQNYRDLIHGITFGKLMITGRMQNLIVRKK